MPPKPQNSENQEGRILLAISSLKNSQIPSVRQAASIFQVPETTLRRRLHGISTRSEKRANSHKLSLNEEQSIIQWILSLGQRGAAPRPAHVRDMANILLANRGQASTTTVGDKWVYNFIKRHDILKSRFSRRYNYQRAKCEDPKIIQEWFNSVQIIIMQHGIAYEDIYNFDETGYAMGLVATAKVVTSAEMTGKPFLIQPGNREWVTSIECINSTGWALPPCIIFKGKVHIEGWYQDTALPKDWRIEVSDNGWTTDNIGLRWLQNTFIPAIAGRKVGTYSLLVLDGHGSHLTPQFDKICSENNIIPICMPPHSSHLLQPLDVGCFSPLKRAYGRLVENKARLGFNHIDKFDFLDAYPEARTETFKANTIKNSFEAAGLVPLNPGRVLEQLNIHLKTPTPPCSRSTNSAPKTPHNLKQLDKQASTIKRLISQNTASPQSPTKCALNQLIKGCKLAMNSGILLAQENQDLRAAHEKKQQGSRRSRQQMVCTEGLSIQEGQDLIEHSNEAVEVSTTAPIQPALTENQPSKRAPPRCSDCHIIGHRRLQCPNRMSN